MKLMKMIVFLSNLGASTCAESYDETTNPLEWGSALMDWIQNLIP